MPLSLVSLAKWIFRTGAQERPIPSRWFARQDVAQSKKQRQEKLGSLPVGSHSAPCPPGSSWLQSVRVGAGAASLLRLMLNAMGSLCGVWHLWEQHRDTVDTERSLMASPAKLPCKTSGMTTAAFKKKLPSREHLKFYQVWLPWQIWRIYSFPCLLTAPSPEAANPSSVASPAHRSQRTTGPMQWFIAQFPAWSSEPTLSYCLICGLKVLVIYEYVALALRSMK